MRKLWLLREDYELFQQEINPYEFEFFRNHLGTFKRMWADQGKQFWTKYVETFKEYVRKYGCVKDLIKKHCDTITKEEMDIAVDEIFIYIFTEFVTGKVSMAKNLIMDCVVVAQNQHTLAQLDKQSCLHNPFYCKTTREVFRKLFGPPNERRTYMKLLCGYPVFVRFAGSVVVALRRWLDAEIVDVDSEYAVKAYFDLIHEGSPDSSKQIKMKTVAVGISRNREKGGVDLHITKDLHKPTEHSYDIHVPKKKSSKPKSKHSLKNLQSFKSHANSRETEELQAIKETADNNSDKTTSDSDKDSIYDDNIETIPSDKQDFVSKEDANDSGRESLDDDKSINDPDVAMEFINDRPTDIPEVVTCDKLTDVNAKVVEEVANVTTVVEVPPTVDEKLLTTTVDEKLLAKLHRCANCDIVETEPKTFKRCHKCKGKTNPRYYCSRNCQAIDWRLKHKSDHKDQD